MMLLPSFAMLCASLSLGNGYIIDKASCSGDKYHFAEETAEQALDIAHKIGASIAGPAITPNTARLLELLFNVADPEVGRKLISMFQEEKFDVKLLDKRNKLVIFCNRERLQEMVDEPEKLFDPINEVAVNKKDPCADLLPFPTFMYTSRFGGNHFDTITFCPWFLEYAMEKKYSSTKSYESFLSFLAVAGVDKVMTKIAYTPIDLLSLWDKTMLHEMMHTTPAGLKDDVGDGILGGFGCSGWKNCKKLALDSNSNLAKTNADSWALFGSALCFLDNGYIVKDDGAFNSNPRGNRKRWSGSGAARGIDTVKIEAMKQFV